MTVLDFDPPHPTLRLVASSGAATGRDRRYRDGAPLHGAARELYRDVLEAALLWQVSIDPDALRVVLAAKQNTSASPARAFSAAAIWQLMFVDVVAWCRNRQLDVPTGCASALLRVIEYLEITNSLDELSDSPEALYDALDECTGGWVDDTDPATPSPVRPRKARRSLPSKRGTKRT